ncbi:DUF4383 domain-containing protein [Kitasatospora cheerisanensis]|uniref:DUF4383 domain-containing protein n=1 Tax=Kitasatospora cheerisanensis KCTC 2395 TaxID=1348663 RepID=A0A066ZBR9_9ACTN|nr:DUF4383 domain-containing protein [Kitasatospora cheerisanensis]KDN87751.1 hypothetical protein KCH_03980 [Kitasatospora cheerisanensis KCTC 2395]
MDFRDEFPADRRLARVHRAGAGLCGVVLLAFGCLGLADGLAFFGTTGERVAGLSSNGLLSVVSIATAAVLIVGAVIGGRTASTITIAVGGLFVLSGFVNLALLDSGANVLAFRIPNVVFSFVMGLVIATCGMYGRVSGKLPFDNPYWRHRHPGAQQQQAAAPAARAGIAGRTR